MVWSGKVCSPSNNLTWVMAKEPLGAGRLVDVSAALRQHAETNNNPKYFLISGACSSLFRRRGFGVGDFFEVLLLF